MVRSRSCGALMPRAHPHRPPRRSAPYLPAASGAAPSIRDRPAGEERLGDWLGFRSSVGRKQRSGAERGRGGERTEERRGEERGMRESARLVLEEEESDPRGGGDATGEQAERGWVGGPSHT
jgi:hypothetical protein